MNFSILLLKSLCFSYNFLICNRCLPCGHTICSNCIENIQKSSENNLSQCPVCRTKFDIKSKLPRNYSVLEILEGPEIVRASSSGYIKNLPGEPNSSGISLTPIMWCEIHPGKKIKFFCITCEKKICSKCFGNEHVRHTLERPMFGSIFTGN